MNKEDQGEIVMGNIFMGIGNIVITKPSPSSSSSTRDAVTSKEVYIDIWEIRG